MPSSASKYDGRRTLRWRSPYARHEQATGLCLLFARCVRSCPAPPASLSTASQAQDAGPHRSVTPTVGGARHMAALSQGSGHRHLHVRQDAARTIRTACNASEDEVMEPRFNLFDSPTAAKVAKRFYNASLALDQSTLPKTVRELVELRVSQINGCGFCVDIHTKEAAAAGETAIRLHLVAAWRESAV